MSFKGIRAAFAGVVLGASVGCSGGSANAPKPESPTNSATDAKPEHEVATGNTLTEFQKNRLLGHYSTLDGASGFILDRTVTPWKAKLDGVTTAVTLQETNEPRRGVKEYASDDHSIWVRIDEEGTVELFQGPKQHEGVSVTRDADAERL